MYEDLEKKLLKAKIELMTRSAFISTIALSVRHIITNKVPTAQVNGVNIKYNPTMVKSLSVTQIAFVMAHECWHMAFQHAGRVGGRNHLIWNYAGDFVINHMLHQDNFDLPSWVLYDSKYDDKWSTEAVYDDIIQNNPNMTPQNFMQDLVECSEEDLSTEITNIIIRAKTQAEITGGKKAGRLPGEILRIIDEILNPRLPWPVILNRFLDQRVREEYSWARRNRRFGKVYLPSMHSLGLGHLTFAIDTSGSVSDKELQGMLSEIVGIQRVFNPTHMTIIDCDTKIHNIYKIDQCTEIMDLKFNGGGGTRFQPVLDYVKENPTQALVYFTDLYGETQLEEIKTPILWICNSDHDPAPIGETIYVG
jgi:predicted metal-dependent peptidase